MGCIISSRKKKPATKGSLENRPRFNIPPSGTLRANDQNQKVSELSELSDNLGPKELKREESVLVVSPHPRSTELAASGWPPWLIGIASEALVGWIPRRESHFEKHEQIGGGTFSRVFKARDLLRNKTVALKRIRFDPSDKESIKCIAREIIILRKLDHPNVIKLEGLMLVDHDSSILYMIFEYMEHDLLGLSSLLGVEFSESQVKCYMTQLLRGLDYCHTNHVLHRDIKSSNLLINGNGVLKIADFGLSTFFDPHNSVPLTSNVVTLWYRPPELLLGASHYSVGVDMWSTGCVIGEIYAGRPIFPGKNETDQLQKIFELCGSPSEEYWTTLKLQLPAPLRPMFPYGSNIAETFKKFPDPVISLLETLLSIDPHFRGTAATALNSEYFNTEPLACHPSSLPKYTPSKEIDIKKRHGTRKPASQTRRIDEPQTVQPILADSSLTKQLQKTCSDSKSRETSYIKSYEEDEASSLQDHSPRHMQTATDITTDDETGAEVSYTDPSRHNGNLGPSMNMEEHIPWPLSSDNSYTKSYEEEETSSLQDHSPTQMQTATDVTTEDETGAEVSYTDPSRRKENQGRSMSMEEHIPWPLSKENSYTKSSEEDETSNLQDHSPTQMQTAMDMTTEDETEAEVSYTDPSGQNENLGRSMSMEEHIPWPVSRDNSYTKSYEEVSSLQDHSPRQTQTSMGMTTEDETGAEVSYTNPSRHNQNLGGSINTEEHIPWPLSPSKVNATAILPSVCDNGTSSSETVGIMHTLIEDCTVN